MGHVSGLTGQVGSELELFFPSRAILVRDTDSLAALVTAFEGERESYNIQLVMSE